MDFNVRSISEKITKQFFDCYKNDLLEILKLCKKHNYTEENKLIFNDLDNAVYYTLVNNNREAIVLKNQNFESLFILSKEKFYYKCKGFLLSETYDNEDELKKKITLKEAIMDTYLEDFSDNYGQNNIYVSKPNLQFFKDNDLMSDKYYSIEPILSGIIFNNDISKDLFGNQKEFLAFYEDLAQSIEMDSPYKTVSNVGKIEAITIDIDLSLKELYDKEPDDKDYTDCDIELDFTLNKNMSNVSTIEEKYNSLTKNIKDKELKIIDNYKYTDWVKKHNETYGVMVIDTADKLSVLYTDDENIMEVLELDIFEKKKLNKILEVNTKYLKIIENKTYKFLYTIKNNKNNIEYSSEFLFIQNNKTYLIESNDILFDNDIDCEIYLKERKKELSKYFKDENPLLDTATYNQLLCFKEKEE